MKANEFLYHNKIRKLKKYLSSLEEVPPSKYHLVKELASLYYSSGELEESQKYFDFLFERGSLTFPEAEVYASIFIRKGNPRKAMAIIRAYPEAKTQGPDYICDLAVIYAVDKNQEKAFYYLELAKEKYGKVFIVYLSYAMVYYYLDYKDKGREAFSDLISKVVNPEQRIEVIKMIAKFCLETGNYQDAKFFLTEIDTISKVENYFSLALIFINLEMYSKALVFLNSYLNSKEGDPYAYFLKGICESNLPRREKEAIFSFKKAVELEPENYIFVYYLALQYISMEKYELAVEVLEEIFDEELLEEYPEYVYTLAMSKFLLGEEEVSLRLFQEGLRNFPDNFDVLHGYLRAVEARGKGDFIKENLQLYYKIVTFIDKDKKITLNLERVIDWLEENLTDDFFTPLQLNLDYAKKLLLQGKYLESYGIFHLFWRETKDTPNQKEKFIAGYNMAKILSILGLEQKAFYYIEQVFQENSDNFFVLYLYIILAELNGFSVPAGIKEKFKENGEKKGEVAITSFDWESAYEIYKRLFKVFQKSQYFYYYLEALDNLDKKNELEKELKYTFPQLDFSDFPQLKMVIEEEYLSKI